jgi:hypothetical protein
MPNNSLDASGMSVPLMLDLRVLAVRAAASIRALGGFVKCGWNKFYVEETNSLSYFAANHLLAW